MQKISSTSELRNAIFQLELKQTLQGKQLKDQFYLTYDSFKSVNLFKKIMVEMATSPALMSGIIKTILELTKHNSNKQTVEASSGSMIKNIIRTIIKYGLTNFAVEHADTIRLVGHYIIRLIFPKKEKKNPDNE
jgi:hypothetical protein